MCHQLGNPITPNGKLEFRSHGEAQISEEEGGEEEEDEGEGKEGEQDDGEEDKGENGEGEDDKGEEDEGVGGEELYGNAEKPNKILKKSMEKGNRKRIQ